MVNVVDAIQATFSSSIHFSFLFAFLRVVIKIMQASSEHTSEFATHLATIHWFAVSPEPKVPSPQPPSPIATLYYGIVVLHEET